MNEDWLSKYIGQIDESYIAETESFQPQSKRSSYWRDLIIKWGIVILGVAILLTLLLVWPPRDTYKLVKENGTYYIYIDKKYIASIDNSHAHMTVYNASKYDSLDAMEMEIRKGTFTANEFYRLGHFADEDGKIPIFDLDNMKDAQFPEGLSHYIEFFPHEYHICGKGENGITDVSMVVISEERFQQRLAHMGIFANAAEIAHWSASATDPRENLPVIESNGMQYRYYVIVTDAVRYYVQELDIATADPAYRYAYLIFGQAENGTFFELKISNLEKQADLDWLTTFRLVDRT
jgi:hypothetical protein